MRNKPIRSWVAQRSDLWSWFIALFGVAVFFNFMWEVTQSPLYRVAAGNVGDKMWHCFLASLGDGLLVLLIAAIGWALLGPSDWFMRPGIRGYAVMLLSGLMISVVVELIAIHVAQRWSYTVQMPLVPGLGIGLVPIAQMLVLPPLIFRVVAWWRKYMGRSNVKGD